MLLISSKCHLTVAYLWEMSWEWMCCLLTSGSYWYCTLLILQYSPFCRCRSWQGKDFGAGCLHKRLASNIGIKRCVIVSFYRMKYLVTNLYDRTEIIRILMVRLEVGLQNVITSEFRFNDSLFCFFWHFLTLFVLFRASFILSFFVFSFHLIYT